MHTNIYGFNKINTNPGLNFVSVYITQTDKYYSNPFPPLSIKNAKPEQKFVGIFHCFKGSGLITIKDGEKQRRFSVKKNELVFLRHVDILSIDSDNTDCSFYCLWFFLSNTALQYNTVFHLDVLPGEDEMIRNIISLLNTSNYNKVYQANGMGQVLLGQIMEELDIPHENEAYYAAFHKLIANINQNLEQNFSVEDLAKQFNLSEKHFRTLFTKYAGKPPKQYIIQKKLEKAAFLLSFTTQSVTNISNDLSFLSPAYFVSCFKKQYKVTPSKYRKTHNSISLKQFDSDY